MNYKSRYFVFILVLFFCESIDLYGNTNLREFHVSVTGNDNNSGSLEKPFKSISTAASIALPGDIITIHEGIYREQINPPKGGNSFSEPIIYQAARGEKVIIKGSEIIKNWNYINNDTWFIVLKNSFFKGFNPYSDLIHGDWFIPTSKDREYHTGAVYLNGHWLNEAEKYDDLLLSVNKDNPLWWAMVDKNTTTIWAQFPGVNPNIEEVEINVRRTVIYPERPLINYLVIKGFILEHAATNWAPPTAEQLGLIGTNWSKGWVIENNTIRYSKCVGISLGKYGDVYDNKGSESAEGFIGTIERAISFGWDKETVGSHIVRNNKISDCEQAGIVGSLGCAFSIIENNEIFNIYIKRLFKGFEMAAIKFHGAVDVIINHNYIYNCVLGVWLDWMAQGAQILDNLMCQNDTDIFIEVSHGPTLIANNILMSEISIMMNAKSAVFAHNLISGKIDAAVFDGRFTPYLKKHSTLLEGFTDNRGGDIKFLNNLFIDSSDISDYSSGYLPISFEGNVYTMGTKGIIADFFSKKFATMDEDAWKRNEKFKIIKAIEKKRINADDWAANGKLMQYNGNIFIEISLNKKWLEVKREIVKTRWLGESIISKQHYENPDGSKISLNKDYLGLKRKSRNPSPGPFEIKKDGRQRIKIW